jgi:hypothetical protein
MKLAELKIRISSMVELETIIDCSSMLIQKAAPAF